MSVTRHSHTAAARRRAVVSHSECVAKVKVAVTAGDLSMLKEAERESGGIDLRGLRFYKGRNLLHLAVMGCCGTRLTDVIWYLVEEKGFDVNATSEAGETVAFCATETPWAEEEHASHTGVVPLLTYFLARGVDPAAPDARGCTPLHNVAESGHKEAMLLLLSWGVPVDPLYHHGTPLHLAADNGHAHAVKILLEHGADPNRVVNGVYSPLLLACSHGTLECVKLLVEAGADVNFRPPKSTMLLAAIDNKSVDIVNFMLEAGIDPNIHDGYGRYPIMQAALNEQHELVEILFPRTNPIPSLPDWSVGGIIGTMKTLPRELYLEPIDNIKSEAKESFANGDYGYALYCFLWARSVDPYDATVYANLSLCCLKLREGDEAELYAKQCQRLHPRWVKAWFREGEALSLMQKHIGAVTAFQEALELDPDNVEIINKLREAKKASKKYH